MRTPRRYSTIYNVDKMIIQLTVYIITYSISTEKSYFHFQCWVSWIDEEKPEWFSIDQYWQMRIDFLWLPKDLQVFSSTLFDFVDWYRYTEANRIETGFSTGETKHCPIEKQWNICVFLIPNHLPASSPDVNASSDYWTIGSETDLSGPFIEQW